MHLFYFRNLHHFIKPFLHFRKFHKKLFDPWFKFKDSLKLSNLTYCTEISYCNLRAKKVLISRYPIFLNHTYRFTERFKILILCGLLNFHTKEWIKEPLNHKPLSPMSQIQMMPVQILIDLSSLLLIFRVPMISNTLALT